MTDDKFQGHLNNLLAKFRHATPEQQKRMLNTLEACIKKTDDEVVKDCLKEIKEVFEKEKKDEKN